MAPPISKPANFTVFHFAVGISCFDLVLGNNVNQLSYQEKVVPEKQKQLKSFYVILVLLLVETNEKVNIPPPYPFLTFLLASRTWHLGQATKSVIAVIHPTGFP
jgi:hypothetical protein